MIYYVAHKYDGSPADIERAIEICNELQQDDLNNCYICPVFAFSYIDNLEMSEENLIELRLDLLSVCDVMLIASKPDKIMRKEIEFADEIGMEIENLEY